MALVLDGTNGVSGVDGTASNPSLEGTDSNTGIFYPAADTVAIGTGGTERLRVDSAGNAGLAVTPSAWASTYKVAQVGNGGAVYGRNNSAQVGLSSNYYNDGTDKYLTTAAATAYVQSAGSHLWYNAPSGTAGNAITFTQAMTLDASGNLGIGTSSPASKLHISGGTVNIARIDGSDRGGAWAVMRNGSVTGGLYNTGVVLGDTTSGTAIWAETGFDVRFYTNGSATDKARITSGGAFLIGQTSQSNSEQFGVLSSNAGAAVYGRNTNSSGFSAQFINGNATGNNQVIYSQWDSQAPNNATAGFLYCGDSVQVRAQIRSNGGLANFSANNVNLSDARLKTDVQPADSYLQKICSIPVVTYLYKDQTDTETNLGVLAQDVEAVAPELVDNSGFGETPEDGVPYKSIYQTDLQYALMKSIQELKAIVDAQAAEIAALKAQP